jgi:hypothetical protein
VTAAWTDMRQRLLTTVFYAHPPEGVAASTDLVRDGYLDSMTVLVVLGLFDDELGEGAATRQARIPDTASLAAMQRFYERLRVSG